MGAKDIALVAPTLKDADIDYVLGIGDRVLDYAFDWNAATNDCDSKPALTFTNSVALQGDPTTAFVGFLTAETITGEKPLRITLNSADPTKATTDWVATITADISETYVPII